MMKQVFEINDTLSVTFIAQPRWENDGIGDYEFWGSKESDKGEDYLSCEYYGIEYDWKKYSTEEKKLIDKYLEDNYEEVESVFVNKYKIENDLY